MSRRIDAEVFVDWQSQLINSGAIAERRADRACAIALRFVTSATEQLLDTLSPSSYVFAVMHVYHGWHRGLTATERHNALRDEVLRGRAPTMINKARFDWGQPFGHTLASCSPRRLHRKLNIHLPDTNRKDLEDPSRTREKMVDVALAADLLTSARSAPDSLRIVLAEDDDIMPAVFAAEVWAERRTGRTVILRSRGSSAYVNTEGLIFPLERA